MVKIIFITAMSFLIFSCNTQKKHSLQKIAISNEVVFSTKKWKNLSFENLMEYYKMSISNREKDKINQSLNIISGFDDYFLEETFSKLGFTNQFYSDTEYYFIGLFIEGEVFYNQIYVLEVNSKCNDYLYTQAGRTIEFKNNKNVSCDIKQNHLINLLRSEQTLNTGVRNNMIILWYLDKDRNENFKIFYNPNYLQIQEADNTINKKGKR